MDRADAAMHHEVRLRAAGWAKRLVAEHGDEAEALVNATLRRRDLTERERLAARYTREALRNLRLVQSYTTGPRRRPQRGLAGMIARLVSGGFRARPRPAQPAIRQQRNQPSA